MKLNIINILLSFVLLQNMIAQDDDTTKFVTTAFLSNEEIYYKVAYGLIKGGEASLTITTEPVGDGYLFHIIAKAETTGVVGAMVTIKDVYESYVDISSGYPIKSVRNILEHNYNAYNEVLFFREQGFLRSLNTGDHQAPNDTHDILSAFYFARRYLFSNYLKVDDTISLSTFFDEKFFPVKIKFKKIETVNTKFGKVRCLKFVPLLKDNEVFKEEEQLQIWVTDDQNFIPVKIRVKLPIGSLKCDIIDFKGIKQKDGQLHK